MAPVGLVVLPFTVAPSVVGVLGVEDAWAKENATRARFGWLGAALGGRLTPLGLGGKTVLLLVCCWVLRDTGHGCKPDGSPVDLSVCGGCTRGEDCNGFRSLQADSVSALVDGVGVALLTDLVLVWWLVWG